MSQPLFSGEGPEYYDAAYRHNAAFAQGAPYQTTLTAQEESAFRTWVTDNRVPFDPNESPSDYDMRGYWKESGGRGWTAGSHFPDTYKTPYDTTFSAESRYARPGTPFVWQGDNLVDQRNGQLIYGSSAAGASYTDDVNQNGLGQSWHLEAVGNDGSRRVVQPAMRRTGGGTTDWDVVLNPGETLEVVAHGDVSLD